VARSREPNNGVVVHKTEAAHVAGQERERLEGSGFEVDRAELAGPRVEHPQAAVVEPGRVGHRQAGRDDLAGRHFQNAPTVAAAVAPTVGDVGHADERDIRGSTVAKGQSVEMAAVFCRQSRDMRRLPQRRKAVRRVHRRQTVQARVDEHNPAIGIADDIMDIKIARRVSDARDEQPVIAFVEFAGAEDVLEPPELKQRTHPERLPVPVQPHAAVERALENGERSRRVPAEKEQLARLIGRESEADVVPRQPRNKVSRRRHFEPGSLRRG
jgi:hypothetical protein